MPLLESAEWQDFRSNPAARGDLRDQLVKALGPEDVEQLLELCATGSTQEREAAIRVLMVPSRWKDPRLGPAARERFASHLRAILRLEYPRPPLGPLAFQALAHTDPEMADAFVVDEVSFEALDEAGLRWLVTNLSALATARTLAKLQEIEAKTTTAEVRSAARQALAVHGVTSQSEIRAAAESWRREPSRAALNRIYHLYVSRLPLGTPMSDIEEVLGPPARRSGAAYWYEAGGASLYLERDSSGALGAAKLS